MVLLPWITCPTNVMTIRSPLPPSPTGCRTPHGALWMSWSIHLLRVPSEYWARWDGVSSGKTHSGESELQRMMERRVSQKTPRRRGIHGEETSKPDCSDLWQHPSQIHVDSLFPPKKHQDILGNALCKKLDFHTSVSSSCPITSQPAHFLLPSEPLPSN